MFSITFTTASKVSDTKIGSLSLIASYKQSTPSHLTALPHGACESPTAYFRAACCYSNVVGQVIRVLVFIWVMVQ